jgi:hypothetical protein
MYILQLQVSVVSCRPGGTIPGKMIKDVYIFFKNKTSHFFAIVQLKGNNLDVRGDIMRVIVSTESNNLNFILDKFLYDRASNKTICPGNNRPFQKSSPKYS